MVSIIVLVTPCDFLSTMVKHSKFSDCPVIWLCWWIGDGSLRCSFSLFPRSSLITYNSGQSLWGQLNQYIIPVLHMLYLALGEISKEQMVLLPLKCTCTPKLLQVFLNLLLSPFVKGTTMEILLLLDLVLLVLLLWPLSLVCGLLMLYLWLNLTSSLLRAWEETACM